MSDDKKPDVPFSVFMLRTLWEIMVEEYSTDEFREMLDKTGRGPEYESMAPLKVGDDVTFMARRRMPPMLREMTLLLVFCREHGKDFVKEVLDTTTGELLPAYAKLKGLDTLKLPAEFSMADLMSLCWFRGTTQMVEALYMASGHEDELAARAILLDFVTENGMELFEDPLSVDKAIDMLKIRGMNPAAFRELLKTTVLAKAHGDTEAFEEGERLLREILGDDYKGVETRVVRLGPDGQIKEILGDGSNEPEDPVVGGGDPEPGDADPVSQEQAESAEPPLGEGLPQGG